MNKTTMGMEEYVKQHLDDPALVAAWDNEKEEKRVKKEQKRDELLRRTHEHNQKARALIEEGDTKLARMRAQYGLSSETGEMAEMTARQRQRNGLPPITDETYI